MRRKNHTHQQDIDDLKKQNTLLEQQGRWWDFKIQLQYAGSVKCHFLFLSCVCVAAVRALEKAKGYSQLQTNYSSDGSLYTNRKGSTVSAFDGGSDSSSESEPDEPPNRKKLRVEPS